jgi:hypothetical protein
VPTYPSAEFWAHVLKFQRHLKSLEVGKVSKLLMGSGFRLGINDHPPWAFMWPPDIIFPLTPAVSTPS